LELRKRHKGIVMHIFGCIAYLDHKMIKKLYGDSHFDFLLAAAPYCAFIGIEKAK
jgi:hypothetical protein